MSQLSPPLFYVSFSLFWCPFPFVFFQIQKGLLSNPCLFFQELSSHIADFNCMFHSPEAKVYSKLMKCGVKMPTVFFN